MDFTDEKNLGKAKKDDDIIAEARKRHAMVREFYREQRQASVDELEFSLGNKQWDDDDETPMQMTFNRIVGAIDQVTGDQRQNRPEIKVRAEDRHADPNIAEKLNGWIRKIRYESSADAAIDFAFEHAVAGRFGFWRVTTEYLEGDVSKQTARIKRILNNCAVGFDPASQEWDRSDAMYAFIDERFTREEFYRRFPKASTPALDADEEWATDDGVRVTEYWRKVPKKRTLVALSDGRTVTREEVTANDVELKSRVETIYEVERYLLNGDEVLEGPDKWPGKYIPIVPVWGKEFNIQGETRYRSLTTYAIDPQREYNYAHVQGSRVMRMVPTAPFVGTRKQLGAVQEQWNDALVNDYMALFYDPDPEAPGPPQRSVGPTIPPGALQMMQISADEIKITTGYFDPSLGAKSNETSGKAIMARQREGDVGSFAFPDNLCRSLVYTGKILVDLAPKIMDTEYDAAIMDVTGETSMVTFNKPTGRYTPEGRPEIENDLRKGSYGVMVTVGPSYSTQRVETVANLVEIGRAAPQMAPLVTAMMAEHMDFPGADRFAEAARMMLPDPIRQALTEESGQEDQDAVQMIGRQLQQMQGDMQKMAQIIEQLIKQAQQEGQADELDVRLKQAQLGGKLLDNQSKAHKAMKEGIENRALVGMAAGPPQGPPPGQPPPQGGEGGFY